MICTLISWVLKSTPISGHILFVSAGMLLSSKVLSLVDLEIEGHGFLIVGEITLALLLFICTSSLVLSSTLLSLTNLVCK